MKYSHSVEYNISTKLDKSGLTQLQTQIKQVELTMQQMANKELISGSKVETARGQLQGLSSALTKAFNPSLGILDLSKFRAELTESKVTAQGLQTAFNLTGAQGAQAFGTLARQIGNFNNGFERTSSTLDKMYVTFQNTFRWGLISSFFSSFMNAIHQSVQYAKDLDDSLTQIMLVTDYSRDSMNEYAKAANEAAKAVGQTTVGMTNASLIFAQQGYDLDQSQQLATLSAKLANASQQDTAATSDQITAYMNAYGLQNSMDELVQAMDNWAKIANISAADVEEIALASQRAASMANAVGVSGEALAAQIATIESVTREAPEQIGNGLKTLYARFSDLKLGKDDEDGIGLGKVTSTLQQIGVQVLDAFGNVRDMDDIIEDLMVVWQDLDDTSKTAAAQALAGKHQVNRFMALMENADMYREYKGATGAGASGTLEQMNAEYLDSLQGRMTKLQSTLEGLFNDVFTTDMVYPLIDALTGLAKAIDTLFKSVGGGSTVILGLASAFTKLFSQNLARSINDFASNQQITNIRKSNLANIQGTLEQTGLNNTGVGQFIQAGANRANVMNNDQYRDYSEQLNNYIAATENAIKANQQLEDTYMAVAAAAGMAFKDRDLIFKEGDDFNLSNLLDKLNAIDSKDLTKKFSEIDFSSAINSVEDFSNSLSNLDIIIQQVKKQGVPSKYADLDKSLKNATTGLENLRDKFIITEDEFTRSQEILQRVSKELQNGGVVSENTSKDFEQLNIKMARFSEILGNLTPEILSKGPAAIQKAVRDAVSAAEIKKINTDSSTGFIENLDKQINIDHIIKTTSAYGQLAFAIQSIQNLGSVWVNEDLNLWEKLLQIATNLGVALPSIISALKSLTGISNLKEAFSSWIHFNDIQKTAIAAAQSSKTAEEALIATSTKLTLQRQKQKAAEEAVAAAKEKDSVTTEELNALERTHSAQSGWVQRRKKAQANAHKQAAKAKEEEKIATDNLNKAEKEAAAARQALLMAGITIALGVIAAAYSNYVEKIKNITQNAVDNYNKNYEKTQVDTSNFDKLYEEYKKTGNASDELTQASKDLAQQLGIVGGGALVASGNFTQLAIEIENAKNAANDLADISAENAMRGLNDAANTHYLFDTNDFLYTASYASDVLSFVDQFGNSIGSLSLPEKIAEVDEAIANEQQHYNELIQQQNELENSTLWQTKPEEAAAKQASLNREIEKSAELLNNLGAITQTDEYTQGRQIIEQQAERQINNLSEDEFEDMSYDEITAALTDVSGDYQWIAQQYQLICAQLGEDAGRAYLEGLMRESNLDAWAEGQWTTLQNLIQNNPIESVTEYGPGDYHEVHRGEAGLENLQQFGETNNLSTSNLIKISEMVDWTDPDIDQHMNELLASLQEDLDNGLSIDEAIFNQGIQQGTISDEEILQHERDDKGYVGEEWGRDTEGVIEYANSLRELAESSDQISDNLIETEDNAEEVRKITLKLADANSRLNKGVKTLQDNWEDWNDVLSDSANEGTEEYSQALEGVEEALSDIFDYDIGEVFADSTEFIKENLELIGEAAEGDVEAIQELAEAAATQILIDAGFDFDNLDAEAQQVVDFINTYPFEDLEIGATLDDTGFTSVLQAMLDNGTLTIDQLNAILNSLLFEPDITWEPVDMDSLSSINNNAIIQYEDSEGQMHEATMQAYIDQGENGQVYVPIINGSSTSYQGPPAASLNPGSRRGGGGGKGGGCFIAGTLISLQNQFKNIEDIQIGDVVLSYNEEIHQNEYSIVLQTMIHDVTEEIYDLYIEDEILTVTGIHRFYIRRKHNIEWIPASDLHIGDYVLFADGNWHPIFKIKVRIRSLLVYNFEVSHNHNYYVGRNRILAHNKGGKGGGGGKAKTIEPKEKKEHKKDYYERVDSQLDKLKEQLSGIEKQEDRLIGDKARANQAKQIALIRKEIDLEKERLKILQNTKDSELKDVKAAITAKDTAAQDILKGRGIKFNIPEPEYDENGIITNYEKISEKIDEAHNKLIQQYNDAAAAGNEDLTKTIEEAIQKYDDYSGAILENVQRQNDIQKEIESTKNTIQELEDSIEDIQIELYKASMEAIDNLKDLNEKWAEFEGFLTGMPTDSPFRDLTVDLLKLNSTFEIGKEDAAKYYQEIIDGKIAAQNATTDQAEKEAIQASINYFVGLRDGLTDDMLNNGLLGLAMEDLKQLEKWYKDPSLKDNPFGNNQKALAEAYQEGYERVLELSQDWQDLQEDIIDSVIDGYDEIADKQDRQLGKYTRLADQLEQLADNYALSYGDESYQALSDIGKQQGETLRAQLQQYKEIYKYWQEQYQEALKTGNEELINSIEDHMNDVEDEMRDIANEAAETFVDAYEKAVDAAIQKMNKTLIGEADFDRLDRNWEWQDKMIEGYLDDVEKAYEIEKLRGDYMDMLNEAQGASLATQNKIRAAMNEQLQLLEDQTTVSQFDVDLANARLLVLQKQIALEDAQRNKNQMQLRRDSQGNYRYVYRANQDEIAKARKELLDAEREVYKMSQDHMKEVRQNVADAINEFIDQWRTISTDPNLSEDKRKEQLEELVNNIKPILAVYAEDLKNGSDGIAIALGDMINSSTDEMAAAASEMFGKIYNEEGNLAENTGTLWWDVVAKFTNEIFPNIDSAIDALTTTTYEEMDELRDNLTGPDGVIPDVTDALVGEDGFASALLAAADAITNEDPTKGLNAAMKSLGESLEDENAKLKEGINNITNYTTALAGAITTLSQAQGAITDLQKITLDNVVYQFRAEVQDNTQNASQNIEAASYDTGGYTGDWGEDGKIAILHQKELILNAEDTRNILSAVDIVRQMTSTLGNALTNYSIGGARNSLMNSGFGTVDQRVEIKAEFPNVRDAFEIETALTNLADTAYQYAHRKI